MLPTANVAAMLAVVLCFAAMPVLVAAWDQIVCHTAGHPALGGGITIVGNAATDGNVHWLRSAYHYLFTDDGYSSRMGTFLVGAAGIDVNNGAIIDGYPEHPTDTPQRLTHGEMAAAAALNPVDAQWIVTHHVALEALRPHITLVGVNLAPVGGGGVDVFHGCDPTIVATLIAADGVGVGDQRTKATRSVAAIGGSCALNVPMATVLQYTALITAFPDEWTALRAHYVRYVAFVANHANYDLWVLRDWLYATDRAEGHRLVAALGWAHSGAPALAKDSTTAGIPQQFVKRSDFNGGRTFWGRQPDTVGHVRPRKIGGHIDPLNLVSQSAAGQAIVAGAEELATVLKDRCHTAVPNADVRFLISYGYAGNSRRPSSGITEIDVSQLCTNSYLGNQPVAVGAPSYTRVIANFF